MQIRIYTIGFTKKSAEKFFTALKSHGVKTIYDVRLNNESQLAGFTKMKDLKYFLKVICQIDYIHCVELAPTQDILNDFKKQLIDWNSYEKLFVELIDRRKVSDKLNPADLDGACLLCSEEKPSECHRTLVANYLKKKWNNVDIIHIV